MNDVMEVFAWIGIISTILFVVQVIVIVIIMNQPDITYKEWKNRYKKRD